MIFGPQKLFRDIAHSASVTRGAAMNSISQSAASQQIQDLEKKLGTVLLDRSTRPLTLTPAGRLYLDMCRDVMEREQEFHARLDELRHTDEGVVRLASIYSIGISEMESLRQEFARRMPKAELHVEYLRPDKLYAAVRDSGADLGLVSYPVTSRDLHVIPWREEEMSVAAAPGHPLTKIARLRPEDLRDCEFVGFDEDLTIRRELDRYFRERGIELRVTMQFDNIQSVKEAVALGAGVSVLPSRTMRAEIAQRRLVSIPLRAPGLVRPIGIVHRRKARLTGVVKAFLDLLQTMPAPQPVMA